MIEAGVNVVQALATLEEQTDDKYLREIIAEIRSDVEAGMILSQAFGRHPKVFNRLFVAMIEAGESSGTLDHGARPGSRPRSRRRRRSSAASRPRWSTRSS